jgi:hypothetical protein
MSKLTAIALAGGLLMISVPVYAQQQAKCYTICQKKCSTANIKANCENQCMGRCMSQGGQKN